MDQLLEIGKRVQPDLEQATTRWSDPKPSEHGFELLLRDSLQIPICNGMDKSLAKTHEPLVPMEVVFTYSKKTDKKGRITSVAYSVRAKISFSGDRSWYRFEMTFNHRILPTCVMYEWDRGHHLPISKQYLDRAKVIGETLFWSLTSKSGIIGCIGTEHSPIQLLEIWRDMVKRALIKKPRSKRASKKPTNGRQTQYP